MGLLYLLPLPSSFVCHPGATKWAPSGAVVPTEIVSPHPKKEKKKKWYPLLK
jgi:hypothetical protein